MVRKGPFVRLFVALTLLALVIAGCGGGGEPEPTATPVVLVVTPTPGPTTEPTVMPTEEAEEAEETEEAGGAKGGPLGGSSVEATEDETLVSGAVNTLQGVRSAVIQIEAQGSFIDPEFGYQANSAGRGSGFFVNDSGLAITNNHVATGAAFLKVWVAGETSPRNARVLGVSECSDLAVIDIDGEGFPYLEWYTGNIAPGLEVYTAGFPLGDPEYTLTRGIVSKERADGDSNWASADYVIEHDARLNPGNSGGPLVTGDGQVVGVNYAGIDSTEQYFAIGRQEFERVYETLKSGQDVTSIGVNGTVVSNADGSITGIWVSSVDSGSPADQAGVKGGDIIIQLEGLVLGTDGTMADYCDVLRSRDATDTMAVTVLRWDTGELLEGQLNGRELKVTQVFAPETGGGGGGGGGSPAATIEYMDVYDDSGLLTMQVPTTWNDIDGRPWVDSDGTYVGPMVTAAPDAGAFMDTTDVPGVFFVASPLLIQEGYDPSSLLDDFSFWGGCSQQGERQEYDDGLYAGVWEEHMGCGADGRTIIYTIAAMPEEADYLIWIGIQVRAESEFEIAQQIADTFYVLGDLE